MTGTEPETVFIVNIGVFLPVRKKNKIKSEKLAGHTQFTVQTTFVLSVLGSISRKICYLKPGFQILCAVEQFSSLFLG